MTLLKRYYGSFLDIKGNEWRCEIFLDKDLAYDADAPELTFDADSPLTIEWSEKAKYEPLQGSTAKIRIISHGDRSFYHLADCEDLTARLDVYYNDSLYWSGTIDPDFYEEPYECYDNYTVELSFSDFGVLDRIDFALSGKKTVRELVLHCLSEAGLPYEDYGRHIGTYVNSVNADVGLMVHSGNFYDEEGEPNTLKEMLEGVLQPLGMRLIQRCGAIYLYDLYTLAHIGDTAIEWSGDSQTLAKDGTYKNLKITFSPYIKVEEDDADLWDEDDETPSDLSNKNSLTAKTYDGKEYFSYPCDCATEEWGASDNLGFTIWLKDSASGVSLPMDSKGRQCKAFKIVPQLNGSEEQGIAVRVRAVQAAQYDGNGVATKYYSAEVATGYSIAYFVGDPSTVSSAPLFKTDPAKLTGKNGSVQLRLTVEMLLGCKINPFDSEEKNYDTNNNYAEACYLQKQEEALNEKFSFVHIPVLVLFKSDADGKTYVWNNDWPTLTSRAANSTNLAGWWSEFSGYPTAPTAWLSYYDTSNLWEDSDKSTIFSGSFTANRACVPTTATKALVSIRKADSGQPIAYPSYDSGEIWVEVLPCGWCFSRKGKAMYESDQLSNIEFYDQALGWLLLKKPQFSIEKEGLYAEEIDTDDIEHDYDLNTASSEELEIDAICGTDDEALPESLGAYVSAATGGQATTLTRGNVTANCFDLLAGTLYSQYARRMNKISGECELLAHGIARYTEQNQGLKKFIMLSDSQDCRMHSSDAVFAEFETDNYEKAADENSAKEPFFELKKKISAIGRNDRKRLLALLKSKTN